MELLKQVCSLELSKKLKELGVEQESLFWWQEGMTDYKWNGKFELKDKRQDFRPERDHSAYTVAELGEMLPDATTLTRRAVDGQWRYPDSVGASLYIDTEANARGEMLVYLKENKLI